MKKIKKISHIDAKEFENFEDYFKSNLYNKREPLIIKNLNLGNCVSKWEWSYLKEVLNEKKVQVHEGGEPALDFINKNFSYKLMQFQDFLDKIIKADEENQEEFLYLRSLGDNVRKDICDLWKHFPQISNDLQVPDLFDKTKTFSSVFRIASKRTQLWTHYDIMDNILLEVKGEKHVTLFSPEDVDFLYLSGDKSKVLNIKDPDLSTFPLFKHVTHHQGVLAEGDILFIPALWFHNVTNLTSTISVNIFWRHLDNSYYDSSDIYGNKDLNIFNSCENSVDRLINKLSTLPKDYKKFYTRRLISKFNNKLLCQ